MIRLLMIGAAAAVLAVPAQAAPNERVQADWLFRACDGIVGPSGSKEAAAGRANSIKAFGQSVDNAMVAERAPVRSCDAALAHPYITDFRRWSLMRAKAVHHMAKDEMVEGLATLEALENSAGKDAMWERGGAQAVRALRAYAFNALGRRDEALAEVAKMERVRPYAASNLQTAMVLRLHMHENVAEYETALDRADAFLPEARKLGFWTAIQLGDFNAARKRGEGVRFALPRQRGGWTMSGEDIEEYKLLIERADFTGAYAYAVAASGGDAAAMLEAEEAEARAIMVRPEGNLRNGELTKKQQGEYELLLMVGKLALGRIELWRAAIDLRGRASTMAPSAVEAEITEKKLTLPVVVDLMGQAADPNAAQATELDRVSAALTQMVTDKRKALTRVSVADLNGLLPANEGSHMNAVYKKEDAFWGDGLDGYAVKDKDGIITLRFGTKDGSIAMADEGALYSAARYAIDAGYDAFVIDTRQPIKRTTTISGMYVGSNSYASGYEVRLVIRPINAASANASDASRLFNAADVIAATEKHILVKR